MKRWIGVSVVAALSLFLVAEGLRAQEARPRRERPGEGATMAMRQGAPQVDEEQMNRALGELNLTAEQKEKIEALRKEFQKKRAEQQGKMAALREKMREAGDDQEKRAEAQREMRELFAAGGADAAKKFADDVKAVLTEEQKKKFDELQRPVPAIPALLRILQDKAEELKLTDDQKESVKKLADEYKPEDSAPDRRAAMQAEREKMQQLRQNNASPEEIRKAMEEIQAKRAAEAAKAQQEGREFMAKLAKILDEDQMKIVTEAAQAQAGRQPRPEAGERANRGQRQPGAQRPDRDREGGDNAR
jgi:colicin import membrane protein